MSHDAKKQYLSQYRTSGEPTQDYGQPKTKKIEEDYTMFEEQQDEELEDIIEEAEVEESEDSEDHLDQSQEERETMRKNKEEIRNLKT